MFDAWKIQNKNIKRKIRLNSHKGTKYNKPKKKNKRNKYMKWRSVSQENGIKKFKEYYVKIEFLNEKKEEEIEEVWKK